MALCTNPDKACINQTLFHGHTFCDSTPCSIQEAEGDFLQNPEPIPKKRTYSIRMDISFDRELTLEEAEKAIFSALRSAGMKAHKGGAY